MSGVTGAQVRKMLEEIVGKVTDEWSNRFERMHETHQKTYAEVRELRARVHHLEKTLERIGKAALQERL